MVQVLVLRDDMRRRTWVGSIDKDKLLLSEYAQPASSEPQVGRQVIAEGEIRRYHLSLNKYTGQVTVTWVARAGGEWHLWHNGSVIDTNSADVDFPFFAYSQVPIGRVQKVEPPFGLLTYKDRDSGHIFLRRVEGDNIGPQQIVSESATVGGLSLAIINDSVLGRIDMLSMGQIVPTLLTSQDGGRSFESPAPVDLAPITEQGFSVRPGYQRPVVDKGGAFHVPIGLQSQSEALMVNHAIASNILVEAIRVEGRLKKGTVEVFPSTVGSGNTFGNGVSDGHGLIMALSTDEGRLFSSNSSAGGSHFPEAQLLNHEMPLVATFSASECYSTGLTPNVVSMDYIFVEANDVGQPLSGDVYIETWDMPLPKPEASAKANGSRVEVHILNDADLEPGKVTFSFDDPSINITGVDVRDLRNAVVATDREDLAGKTLSFDVLTLFHRHYGEAVVQ